MLSYILNLATQYQYQYSIPYSGCNYQIYDEFYDSTVVQKMLVT